MKKVLDNRIIKIVWNVIYAILVFLVISILLVVVLQRFSNNNIAFFGFRIFNIVTPSMTPEYKIGDVILIKEVELSELKAGDDITYIGKTNEFAGKTITHRIQKIEKKEDGTYRIITKGVANVLEDPELEGNQVKGKVIYKFKVLSLLSSMINKSLNFVYVWVFLPIALIIFINIRNACSNISKTKEDDEKDKE